MSDVGKKEALGGLADPATAPHKAAGESPVRNSQGLSVLSERRRMAEELHKGPIQILWYLDANVWQVQQLAASGRLTETSSILHRLELALQDYEASLLRLTPQSMNDDNQDFICLVTACLKKFTEGSGLRTSLRAEGCFSSLSAAAMAMLLSVLQEALVNVRKHAHATAVEITLRGERRGLRLTLADDGVGCGRRLLSARNWEHWGVKLMRMTVEEMRGTLEVRAGAGRGFQLVLFVPWR
jgi:two-component system nitrate/nitrite sensor histidine kinase NarX